jgi:hypothetical protein
MEQVDQNLSRYTWRRLHRPFSMENEAPPETERQTAVELLRRRSDPNGDWPASPSDRDDEASRAGAVFLMSTARSPEYGPPLTSNPLTVALRCSGSWRHDLECAGAEDLVVFRSRTREVRLSRHLATPPMDSVLCRGGHITTIAGMSPRRRLVVLSDYEGLFAQEGEDTQDANCTGLAAARTHTVLRFGP